MVPFHVETLSLITAVQAAVLALMLWFGIYGDAGRARTSLRIRAVALGLEAAGWGLLVSHAYVSSSVMLLGGNALNLIAQGMSVIALRMLLGEPLRRSARHHFRWAREQAIKDPERWSPVLREPREA